MPPIKTHCKRGHERTPQNVNAGGTCRECLKERWQRPEIKAADRLRDRPNKSLYNAKYRKDNPPKSRDWAKYKPSAKASAKERRDSLSDGYVSQLLGFSSGSAPDELIELKRNQMIYKREMSQLKSAIKGE